VVTADSSTITVLYPLASPSSTIYCIPYYARAVQRSCESYISFETRLSFAVR